MRGFHGTSSTALDPPDPEAQSPTIVQLTAKDAFDLEDRVEATIKQLQADLHEAKSRNIYLNDLVEEQKRWFIYQKD